MTGDPVPPFWLVWRRGGRSPVCEHANYPTARAEAERLAAANPGGAFYVLAPAARGGFDRENMVWAHYAPVGIDLIDEDAGEHAPHGLLVE